MSTQSAEIIGHINARQRLLDGIPVTERRLPLAGVSTAVLEGGHGPPVILLHGPAGNAAHWTSVIPDLVSTHRVIAPDLPGHGASEVAEVGELDGDRILAWLGELIDRTCSSPPALVGYALGGAIAARFAAGHGDRLSGLVLVDALGLTGFEPAPEFGLALNEFLAQPSEHTHEGLWRHCALDLDGLRRRMGERWEQFEAYNVDRAQTPGVMAALGSLMGQFGMPPIASEDLAGIAVPTTLIWGRHDLATRLSVAEAASARYGWPLHVIEDCADDPPIEQPEAFLRALYAADGPRALEAAGFRGEIVDRGHPRYDELRKVFNGMIDRRPALMARCTDARDVSAAVTFARGAGLPLSVYGGGHNVTGNAVCEGGVTIDLRPMKGIEIDAEAGICRAEAGLTWGELDAATQEHGLAVTGGRMSTTGLGGLAVGGGSGWIERKCGYTVDNLLSVETVTADGRILTASESENPELFWATRGGGGNFGVVTRFELRLHPIGPTVLGGMLIYPAEMASAVLANFRDVMADAADEVGSGVAMLTAPHEEFVPEPVRGQPVVGVIVCYCGPPEQGAEALRPLREFGPPALDLVQPMPYTAVQQLIDSGYPSGMRNYWTGDFLGGLPDEAIEVMCRFHLTKPSPLTQIIALPGGGASARVPDGTMAIGQREAPFNIHITSLWRDPTEDDANIAWTREFSAAMKPFTTGRVYVNFIGDEGRDRVVASFGTEGYARLQELKQRYDPDNLFRSNQNIEPRGPV
ncbi:MAG: alpha/beta fold hydrolase [Actinomycetota bacterium]|nr:alpha/beta fold hydrolase [Actinomycetota bacterium]